MCDTRLLFHLTQMAAQDSRLRFAEPPAMPPLPPDGVELWGDPHAEAVARWLAGGCETLVAPVGRPNDVAWRPVRHNLLGELVRHAAWRAGQTPAEWVAAATAEIAVGLFYEAMDLWDSWWTTGTPVAVESPTGR